MSRITVCSFGYKHDQDKQLDARYPDAEIVVFDCRALANPFNRDGLNKKNGTDPEVQAFVFDRSYKDGANKLLNEALEAIFEHRAEHLVVAFGCFGGRHRSVSCAERLVQAMPYADWTIDHIALKES